MNISFEIEAMPGPQWLFGFDISEPQRLDFARLYVAQTCEGPLSGQSFPALDGFLDRCTVAGLELAIPRYRAVELLRHPGVFAWGHHAPGPRRSGVSSN